MHPIYEASKYCDLYTLIQEQLNKNNSDVPTFFEKNKLNQTINKISLFMKPLSSLNKCRISSSSSSLLITSTTSPFINNSISEEYQYDYLDDVDYHYQQEGANRRDRLLPEPNLALISFILLVGRM